MIRVAMVRGGCHRRAGCAKDTGPAGKLRKRSGARGEDDAEGAETETGDRLHRAQSCALPLYVRHLMRCGGRGVC